MQAIGELPVGEGCGASMARGDRGERRERAGMSEGEWKRVPLAESFAFRNKRPQTALL